MNEAEARELREQYSEDPAFIERSFQVSAVEDLLSGADAVARLIEMPAFAPERIHTLIYRGPQIRVQLVVGKTSLWSSIPHFGLINASPELAALAQPVPFDADECLRFEKDVPLGKKRMPVHLSSATKLGELAANAPSCFTMTDDGVSFFHRFCSADVSLTTQWITRQARCTHCNVRLSSPTES